MIEMRLVKTPNFGNTGRAIEKAMVEWGKVLKKDHVRKLTTGSRSGRLYGSHRASAAGEYPAKQTGALAASVSVKTSGKKLNFAESAPYAGYLEDGTKSKLGNVKMLPRPHFKKSVEANISKLGYMLDTNIKRALS